MVERVREVVIEKHGNLKLVVGGKHGYVRVRGGQGSTKNMYQGYTKDKKHSTAAFPTPREAAIALAELERDLAEGLDKEARKKRRKASGESPGACPNPSPTFPILHPSRPDRISHAPTVRHRSSRGEPKFFADTTLDNYFGACGVTYDYAAAQPPLSSSAACQHRLQSQYPQHTSCASLRAVRDSMAAAVAHSSASSACIRARHGPGACACDAVGAVRCMCAHASCF